MRIGITGCEGLIGRAIWSRLERAGCRLRGLDLRPGSDEHRWRGDVCDREIVGRFTDGLDGIVHLAAVTRILVAEADPLQCQRTNVDGTASVLEAAAALPHQPWVIVASSREVYGQATTLPVGEHAPLRPVNSYGRSKARAEVLTLEARRRGLATAIVRFSNVYGDVRDHRDRVVPAFAQAAAHGETLRVEGPERVFDFTHVDDTAHGLEVIAQALDRGRRDLPAVHLTTGTGTTLASLAALAVSAGQPTARIVDAAPRQNDVARFVGDPAQAQAVLGWRARRTVEDGVPELVAAFAAEHRRFTVRQARP